MECVMSAFAFPANVPFDPRKRCWRASRLGPVIAALLAMSARRPSARLSVIALIAAVLLLAVSYVGYTNVLGLAY
jgi:hypothetical protein